MLVSIPTEGDHVHTQHLKNSFEIINLIIENWESGDTESFNWEVSGNQPWFVTTDAPYQGNNCLESGNINDNRVQHLLLSLTFLLRGTVSFARKVDSEGFDYLYFRVDGQDYAEWSGDLAWKCSIHSTRSTHSGVDLRQRLHC